MSELTSNPYFDRDYREEIGVSKDPETSIKILQEHDDGCPAENHVKFRDWLSPWIVPSDDVQVYISREGLVNAYNRHKDAVVVDGDQRWVRLVCNNKDCGGELGIREDEIQYLIRFLLTELARECPYCGEVLRMPVRNFEQHHKPACRKKNVPLKQRIRKELTIEEVV